jgi:hypothetical protein
VKLDRGGSAVWLNAINASEDELDRDTLDAQAHRSRQPDPGKRRHRPAGHRMNAMASTPAVSNWTVVAALRMSIWPA